jgi:hypothetical protein
MDRISTYVQTLSSGTVSISEVKVEIGDKPTPWSPAPSEVGAEDIVYDVSGYNHHATPVGTITVTSPSPRYDVCTHFINGSYLRSEERPAAFLPTDAITVNIWQKSTTWANPISCTEGGGFNFESNPIRFPCYIAGTGYIVATSTTNPSTLNGSWHMITGVYNRQNVKIYIDGELQGSTAVTTPGNI